MPELKEIKLRRKSKHVPMEQAISEGAIALFGEKYSDVVRTIRFGNSIEVVRRYSRKKYC